MNSKAEIYSMIKEWLLGTDRETSCPFDGHRAEESFCMDNFARVERNVVNGYSACTCKECPCTVYSYGYVVRRARRLLQVYEESLKC